MQEDNEHNLKVLKIYSLRDLQGFSKVGSSNLLIHKSTLDFWQLSDDGTHVVKLVNDEQGPIKD